MSDKKKSDVFMFCGICISYIPFRGLCSSRGWNSFCCVWALKTALSLEWVVSTFWPFHVSVSPKSCSLMYVSCFDSENCWYIIGFRNNATYMSNERMFCFRAECNLWTKLGQSSRFSTPSLSVQSKNAGGFMPALVFSFYFFWTDGSNNSKLRLIFEPVQPKF